MASKIGMALTKGAPMEEVDDMAPESDDSGASPEEVAALKLFERAKSPEDKASALKKFVQICGGY